MKKRGLEDRRLTYEEAAELLRLPAEYCPADGIKSSLQKRQREAVARLVRAGQLKADKIGRRNLVWLSDVLRFGR